MLSVEHFLLFVCVQKLFMLASEEEGGEEVSDGSNRTLDFVLFRKNPAP